MGNTINHNTLGDIQSHEYLPGVILALYPEDPATPENHWDTADVYIEELGLTWYNAPIFYHCLPDAPLRENGAIFDGHKGFTVNDRVILFCQSQTAQTGEQLVKNVKVISHEEGVRKCAYNYVIVRAGLSSIEPINLEAPNTEELVTVYDVAGKCPAVILDPDTGDPLEYPCSIDKLLPFLAYAELKGVELFEYFDQGDDQIQVAGASPNWEDDPQGRLVHDTEEDRDLRNWMTTDDPGGNPIQNFFEDTCYAIMHDHEGVGDGTYAMAMDVVGSHMPQIETWDSRSNAFRTDTREYDVAGPTVEGVTFQHAVDVEGNTLAKATSRHVQTAYGETEIWLCMTHHVTSPLTGTMTVSSCDEKWDYFRGVEVPDAIAPSGPSQMGFLEFRAGIVALASRQSPHDNLWNMAYLKRINEGAYHRTIHPALKTMPGTDETETIAAGGWYDIGDGPVYVSSDYEVPTYFPGPKEITGSKMLMTTPIPEDTDNEPAYLSAINLRWDKIDAWYRYDNWTNTGDRAFKAGPYAVHPAAWFTNVGLQWGAESVYADTPLGSMWVRAPQWRTAMVNWSEWLEVTQIRRDEPVNQKLIALGKHSRAVVCQLYVAQRTSLTLRPEEDGDFVNQTIGHGPYYSVVESADPDEADAAVDHVRMPDNSRVHIDDLTPEQKDEVLEDLKIIWSESDDSVIGAQNNRNEFEIMGAADLYGELMTVHTRRNPVDQERTPELESQVADLIAALMEDAETSFDKIFLDLEIV